MFFRKFGQNPTKDHHKIVTSKNDLMSIIFNPLFTPKDVKPLDEKINNLLVIYENADQSSSKVNYRTNVVLASFVTMYARIWLYNLLHKVDTHPDSELLYFDTVKNFVLLFQS